MIKWLDHFQTENCYYGTWISSGQSIFKRGTWIHFWTLAGKHSKDQTSIKIILKSIQTSLGIQNSFEKNNWTDWLSKNQYSSNSSIV